MCVFFFSFVFHEIQLDRDEMPFAADKIQDQTGGHAGAGAVSDPSFLFHDPVPIDKEPRQRGRDKIK